MATASTIIAVGTPASGLDIFTRFQGVLTDPTSIVFDITEPGGTSVGSGIGFKRSTGRHDARAVTIPSGFSISTPWKITWTFSSPVGVVSTACENFCVVAELTSSFSNIQNIVDMVKLDLAISDDLFTEAEYVLFTQKAINKVNRCICLTGTDGELVFDEGTGTITPTPDSSIFDLIIMSIECLIAVRANNVAIGKGIRVKDGETEIDTTASFTGFKDITNRLCADFNDSCELYLTKQREADYKTAAVSAGSVQWYGNRNICESMFHNGQGDGHTRCTPSPYEHGFGHLTAHM